MTFHDVKIKLVVHGAVTIDGKEIRCRRVELDYEAGDIAEVTLTLSANVEIEGKARARWDDGGDVVDDMRTAADRLLPRGDIVSPTMDTRHPLELIEELAKATSGNLEIDPDGYKFRWVTHGQVPTLGYGANEMEQRCKRHLSITEDGEPKCCAWCCAEHECHFDDQHGALIFGRSKHCAMRCLVCDAQAGYEHSVTCSQHKAAEHMLTRHQGRREHEIRGPSLEHAASPKLGLPVHSDNAPRFGEHPPPLRCPRCNMKHTISGAHVDEKSRAAASCDNCGQRYVIENANALPDSPLDEDLGGRAIVVDFEGTPQWRIVSREPAPPGQGVRFTLSLGDEAQKDCACGVDKIGGGIHSDWCPKFVRD